MEMLLKSEQALDILTTISLAQFLVIAIILVAAVIFIFKFRKNIKKAFEDYRQNENNKEALMQQIINNEHAISDLKETHEHDKEVLYENQQKYRQQSLDKQAAIDCQFADLMGKIDELKEMIERQHHETQKIKRNELREKLLSSYRYYTSLEKNPSQSWNEMEAEAFWHSYSDYEELKGNGYMHTVVKPAMEKLIVTKI